MARLPGGAWDRAFLLCLLDEGYDHKAWHGPQLRGAIRRVKADLAVWRPGPGRRNIVEIVVHCAYWKYAVQRRICGGKRGSFPIKGSNWFDLPGRLSPSAWREYVRLLDAAHSALKEAVGASPWSALAGGPGGAMKTPARHVYGIAFHDVYHAGQIQTIKALYKSRRTS